MKDNQSTEGKEMEDKDKKTIEFGIRTFRNVQMAAKVELQLKPKYMNDVFSWKQIQDAIMYDEADISVSDSNISGDSGYKINIDGKWFTHPNRFITGSELLIYRNIWSSNNHVVYKKCMGNDEEVGDAKKVDLSAEQPMHFYTSLRRVNGG